MKTPKQIFLDSLDQPAEKRREYIEQQCGGDAALLTRVLALLTAHEAAGTFLDAVPTLPSESPERPAHKGEGPGDVIDRYHLIRKLGEGGFGTVFLAEQTEPVSRNVALKLIRAGMDSAQIVARFENERQALAMMDHPGIAKVLDAGATETGRPYFVMEYVEGLPITEYANQNKLNLRQRLELMERVCLAVQHAHQKGIIHRDIKPSNILVATVDGEPQPKVIDFGVAKAADPGESFSPLITHEMQIVGTPQYMSPEQATTGVKNIDTRTDVYSLGTVLYELLTGAPPFDPMALRHAALEQICKVVREEVPPKPSTRIATAVATISETASHIRELRSEIDWIVMRALEKEPNRRYQSPAELAADIERYLSHEPVVARPPSAVYQFRKFAARHRLELTAATIVVIALIATAVVSLIMASRAWKAEANARDAQKTAEANATEARAQLERAIGIGDFTNRLLTGIGPSVAKGRDTALLRDLLDAAVEANKRENANKPIIDLTIRQMISSAYHDLGEYDKALDTLETSWDNVGKTTFRNDNIWLESGTALGQYLTEKDRKEDAAHVLEAVIKGYREGGDLNSLQSLNARATLAILYHKLRRHEDAEKLQRELLAELVASKPDSPLTFDIRNSLAFTLADIDRLPEAVKLWEENLAAMRKALAPEDLGILAAMNNLAVTYGQMGQREKSEPLYREQLAIERKIYPPGHPSLVKTLVNYGAVLIERGELEQAEQMVSEADKIAKEKLEPTHRFAMGVKQQMIKLRHAQKRFDEEVTLSYEFRDIYVKAYGPEDPRALATISFVLAALYDAQRHDEAEQFMQSQGGIDKACEKQDPVQQSTLRANYGMVLLGQQRKDAAMEQAKIARALLKPDASGGVAMSRRLLMLEKALGIQASPTTQP
jgi:tetratricopeptide (TPR) repeat protein/predicted Ser/Thr protein kinase